MFSMLIIILAHLPIFTLQRHEGRIFAPMAYTVVVGADRIAALLAHAGAAAVPRSCCGKIRTARRTTSLVRALQAASTRRVLRAALDRRAHRPRRAPSSCSPASLALVPHARHEFLPELNEGAIWINIMLPAGHLRQRGLAAAARASATTAPPVPGSRTVISKAGRPEDGTDPKLINMAEFLVDVKPAVRVAPHITQGAARRSDEPRRSRRFPASSPASRSRSATTCSRASRRSTARSSSRCSATTPPCCARRDRRSCDADLAGARRRAGFVDRAGQVPQLQIEIDRARAARYGLNVADVEDVIETALGGKRRHRALGGRAALRRGRRLPAEERRRRRRRFAASCVDTPSGLRIPLARWRASPSAAAA